MRTRALLGLRLRWLWWRRTWSFQFAHHPLCGRHRDETLRVGRMHLCRSCTLLYMAAALSAALWLAWPGGVTPAVLVGLGGVVIPLSYPRSIAAGPASCATCCAPAPMRRWC